MLLPPLSNGKRRKSNLGSLLPSSVCLCPLLHGFAGKVAAVSQESSWLLGLGGRKERSEGIARDSHAQSSVAKVPFSKGLQVLLPPLSNGKRRKSNLGSLLPSSVCLCPLLHGFAGKVAAVSQESSWLLGLGGRKERSEGIARDSHAQSSVAKVPFSKGLQVLLPPLSNGKRRKSNLGSLLPSSVCLCPLLHGFAGKVAAVSQESSWLLGLTPGTRQQPSLQIREEGGTDRQKKGGESPGCSSFFFHCSEEARALGALC